MEVVVIDPWGDPQVVEIKNSLESLQEIVGGIHSGRPPRSLRLPCLQRGR